MGRVEIERRERERDGERGVRESRERDQGEVFLVDREFLNDNDDTRVMFDVCISTSLCALFFQSCLVRFFRHKIFFLLENWSVKETQNALKHTHTHTQRE